MNNDDSTDKAMVDEPPPFLGQWRRVYVAVLWYLLVLIAVLYVVSRTFEY